MGKLLVKTAKSTVINQEIERNKEPTTWLELNMMNHEQVNLMLAVVILSPLTTYIQELQSSNCNN